MKRIAKKSGVRGLYILGLGIQRSVKARSEAHFVAVAQARMQAAAEKYFSIKCGIEQSPIRFIASIPDLHATQPLMV